MSRVTHPLAPVWDARSKVLILGTMPSPVSRAEGFYYAHPQNRFWPVLAALFGAQVPQITADRRAFALEHGIALFDVLAGCEITGASDASITNPVPNDFSKILAGADIRAVFTTGAKAYTLYQKLCRPVTGREAIPLPSTSAANARMRLAALTEAYRVILPYLD